MLNVITQNCSRSLLILHERYRLHVLGWCIKKTGNEQEAEEITDEVFLKIWNPPGAYTLPKHFMPWLYRVTMNQCASFMRKNRNPRTFFAEKTFAHQITEAHLGEEEIEAHLASEQKDAAVNALLLELPAEVQVCVRLFYQEEKSYRQIAEYIELDYQTVKSNLQMARRFLAKNFKKSVK